MNPLLTMDFQSPIIFNGDSPLHVAVRQGQIEDVREILIQQQVDVNILNSKQETPLHLACSKNDSPIVQLLVAFGANPFIKDSNNDNAYDKSAFDIYLLLFKLLFGHGLRLWIDGPVQADKESPLHTAVRLGRLDDFQRIIEEKIIDINDINANHETPLHLACALGNKHIVHILISNGADMYKKDIFNNAPIHRAVSQGHRDTMDYLITDCACNPNIKGYHGRTLLHFACGIGSIKLVTTLIEKYGISPMATDSVIHVPLSIAVSHGQEEVVRLLIDKYTSLDSTDLSYLLQLACYCGHASVVKTLVLEYKADIDIDESGAFGWSMLGGSIEMVQLLITEFDQDPLSDSGDGNTLLHMACCGGHEELARLLIINYNCSVDVENKIQQTPLHLACSFGHSSIVRMLVSEFKADATRRDDNNDTAVSKAAEGGHVEIVQALITELGCSPEVTGYDGRSLLHEACCSGSVKLAEMLIVDFSLDILSTDDSGNTPLHMACWGGHKELARLLITKYSYSVDVRNKIQETPLHKACSNGHSSINRILNIMYIQCPTFFNGDSPLHVAVRQGRMEDVREILIQQQVDVNILNSKHETPLHLACSRKDSPILQLLIAFGADPFIKDSNNENAYDDDVCLLIFKLLFSHGLRLWIDGPVQADKESPLHTAVRLGKVDNVQRIIEEKIVDIDDTNANHETPLHLACAMLLSIEQCPKDI